MKCRTSQLQMHQFWQDRVLCHCGCAAAMVPGELVLLLAIVMFSVDRLVVLGCREGVGVRSEKFGSVGGKDLADCWWE